eukprot:TRINITY_DN4860_c0_g1_i4.p1 TRINITY_DN4860_c0_g1~~TRINITY_DN4860_c0_g1_i4.p1  ORF type:complete len:255 (-),score=-12.53 TRINITY_DN4860_c0_g1_i4:79-792(-)
MAHQETSSSNADICLYCRSPVETQPSLRCSHVICFSCRNGPKNLVRVISPYSDQASSSMLCISCNNIFRSPKLAASELDRLRCVSCGGICHNACQTTCGHSMCEACAHHVCSTTNLCPACHSQISDPIGPCPEIRSMVNDLVFECKFGCSEQGTLNELRCHEPYCYSGEKKCTGCEKCIKRTLWHGHQARCELVNVECPRQCGTLYPRSIMAIHESRCTYGLPRSAKTDMSGNKSQT